MHFDVEHIYTRIHRGFTKWVNMVYFSNEPTGRTESAYFSPKNGALPHSEPVLLIVPTIPQNEIILVWKKIFKKKSDLLLKLKLYFSLRPLGLKWKDDSFESWEWYAKSASIFPPTQGKTWKFRHSPAWRCPEKIHITKQSVDPTGTLVDMTPCTERLAWPPACFITVAL